jgi:hypothetical protein
MAALLLPNLVVLGLIALWQLRIGLSGATSISKPDPVTVD